MMLRKLLDNRLGRAVLEEEARHLPLHELLKDLPDAPVVAAEKARRAAAAAAKPERVTPPPKAVEAPRVDPKPLAPQTPPQDPPWWEEKLGWRSRGLPPPSYDYVDDVRYETIHEYDPLERWLESEADDTGN